MSIAEFSMLLRAEADIEQRRTRLVRIHNTFHAVSAIVGFGAMQWLFVAFGHGDLGGRVVFGLFMGALTTLVISMLFASYLEETRLDPRMFDWLPAHKCEAFAEFCEENPGVQAYRDKVRDAARRFTMEEYWSMRSWVSEQRAGEYEAEQTAKERAGCQRLYGIASEA